MRNRITYLLLLMESRALDTRDGILVNAMTQDMMLDTPIRKMMMPVISALSRRILGDFFQFDGFIAKQGEQQAVYNGHNGTFGCGEHTADDAADDNDNEQQRRDSLQDGVNGLLKGKGSLAAVAVLFGKEVDYDHAGQTPQDTGQVAGHEQCGN